MTTLKENEYKIIPDDSPLIGDLRKEIQEIEEKKTKNGNNLTQQMLEENPDKIIQVKYLNQPDQPEKYIKVKDLPAFKKN